jgi:hypothetical protein
VASHSQAPIKVRADNPDWETIVTDKVQSFIQTLDSSTAGTSSSSASQNAKGKIAVLFYDKNLKPNTSPWFTATNENVCWEVHPSPLISDYFLLELNSISNGSLLLVSHKQGTKKRNWKLKNGPKMNCKTCLDY